VTQHWNDRGTGILRVHSLVCILLSVGWCRFPVVGGRLRRTHGRIDFILADCERDRGRPIEDAPAVLYGPRFYHHRFIGSPKRTCKPLPDLVRHCQCAPANSGEVRLVADRPEDDAWIDLQPCGGLPMLPDRRDRRDTPWLRIERKRAATPSDLRPFSTSLSGRIEILLKFARLPCTRQQAHANTLMKVAEWSKAHAWKCVGAETVPGFESAVCRPLPSYDKVHRDMTAVWRRPRR